MDPAYLCIVREAPAMPLIIPNPDMQYVPPAPNFDGNACPPTANIAAFCNARFNPADDDKSLDRGNGEDSSHGNADSSSQQFGGDVGDIDTVVDTDEEMADATEQYSDSTSEIDCSYPRERFSTRVYGSKRKCKSCYFAFLFFVLIVDIDEGSPDTLDGASRPSTRQRIIPDAPPESLHSILTKSRLDRHLQKEKIRRQIRQAIDAEVQDHLLKPSPVPSTGLGHKSTSNDSLNMASIFPLKEKPAQHETDSDKIVSTKARPSNPGELVVRNASRKIESRRRRLWWDQLQATRYHRLQYRQGGSDSYTLDRYQNLCQDFDSKRFSPEEPLDRWDVPWPIVDVPSRLTDISRSMVEQFFNRMSTICTNRDSYVDLIKQTHRR